MSPEQLAEIAAEARVVSEQVLALAEKLRQERGLLVARLTEIDATLALLGCPAGSRVVRRTYPNSLRDKLVTLTREAGGKITTTEACERLYPDGATPNQRRNVCSALASLPFQRVARATYILSAEEVQTP